MSGEWDEQQKIGCCIEDPSTQQRPETDKRKRERHIIVGTNINVINNMYLRHTTVITKSLRSELL